MSNNETRFSFLITNLQTYAPVEKRDLTKQGREATHKENRLFVIDGKDYFLMDRTVPEYRYSKRRYRFERTVYNCIASC
ncbi:hypothetical protein [Alteribacillus bidgolensis]|uniref:Uncharacterized protein n=1 Tax=Alteribacillus bidgolensis TaxID=930129 RepID=A0A1G8MDI7_9BACI|nr:hypothetical protein [Alteribacillus bidgolensis]SDI66029.1 hypothetical protein SAMN05216352_1102 [Alteribacillus bidgolensis]